MTDSTSIPKRLNREDVDASPEVDTNVVDQEYYMQGGEPNYLPEKVLKNFPRNVLIMLGSQGVLPFQSGADEHNSSVADYDLNSTSNLKAIIHKSRLILVYGGGGSVCGIIATLFIISITQFFDADTVNVNCSHAEETKVLDHHGYHLRLQYMRHLPFCW